MVRYGVFGVLALIVLIILFSVFKKSRSGSDEPVDTSEIETPPAGVTTIGGMDDQFDTGNDTVAGPDGGTASTPAPGSVPDFQPTSEEQPAAGAMGGSALAGGMEAFTVPGFEGDDEEEETPPPAKRRPVPPPKPAEEEDPFVNLFADNDTSEGTPPPAAPKQPAPKAAAPPPEDVSFQETAGSTAGAESEGQPSGTTESTPQPFDDEETVIVPPPVPPASKNATPTSNKSVPAGPVDLEDIFGSQPLPQGVDTAPAKAPAEPPKQQPQQEIPEPKEPADFKEPMEPKEPSSKLEDPNSMTMPTFVSAPDAANPEESIEVPPQNTQRPKPAEGESDSISLDELFGPDEQKDAAPKPAGTPEPAESPESKPEEQPAKQELSIEDALAATLGAMQSESPDDAPAGAAPSDNAAQSDEPGETLDERTERMFAAQMEKARQAVNEKNWRQAVHVLSIASALHPENEEAKQMLKDARAEKRKAEESV